MAKKIRYSDQINGIQIHKEPYKSVKITQLADDTTLFLRHDNDIINALHPVDQFGENSGLKLNRNKTRGFKLEKNKNATRHIANI